MASNRTMVSHSENLLDWAASRGATDRHTFSGKTSAQLSRDLAQWLYALALLCLISLFAFLYLAQASYVAREVETTATLEATIQDMKKVNNKLRLEIVLKEDLSRIQQEARTMGFAEPQHVEYVEVVLDEPVAPSAGAASNSQQPSLADAMPAPGWWTPIIRQFRDWVAESTVWAEQANGQ